MNKLFLIVVFAAKHFMGIGQDRLTSDSIPKKKVSDTAYVKFDDTRNTDWDKDFKIVEIISGSDKQIQKAYFYKTSSKTPKPLIVSLHTWSGDYKQKDELSILCKQKDVNYIHPDFRGANTTVGACCSKLALADIDEAISYAIKHGNVDTSKIYVMGVSGGGYATLSAFMKSKHRVKKFSAWASITDLEAWYYESKILKNKYSKDILDCTGSTLELNIENAKQRSPLYMRTPLGKVGQSELFIYAGIYDGIQGSVPITHSINFYNKLLADVGVKDKSKYVTDKEKLDLLEFRRPLSNTGNISGRKICLLKEYKNIRLVVFEGNHEMLSEYALSEILKD